MNILVLAAVALVVLLALALMPTKRKPPAAEPIAKRDEPTDEAIASAAANGYPADVVWVSHRLRLPLTPERAGLIESALAMFEREAAARHVARTLGLPDAV